MADQGISEKVYLHMVVFQSRQYIHLGNFYLKYNIIPKFKHIMGISKMSKCQLLSQMTRVLRFYEQPNVACLTSPKQIHEIFVNLSSPKFLDFQPFILTNMGVILSTAKIMGIAYGIKISQYATKYSMKRHHGKERQPSEEQSS